MLQNGPVFNNRNLVAHAAGPRALDPGDRLKLRLMTVRHQNRLGIKSATPEAIREILAEYASSQEDAAR
jgi:hypothetical protein